jgi:hypothetical protein
MRVAGYWLLVTEAVFRALHYLSNQQPATSNIIRTREEYRGEHGERTA